ncbi:hypothetical protein GCM10008955_05140 [Deinococcus malanensis]|uniref:Serine aminopeptidase S33 domain-containing protein n=1 Tax=Deinococcus malanensis TaxID=1706855 RepID=A0ABQ2EMR8_9DEIO|nr:alpha/beta fold hydrolase [Deinococcus malanensis]GGK14683.1 hypothetical protein GCM10008955_05140 [Deinococcus malanensis]
MTRIFNPADPHATPMVNGAPYRVERRVLAGAPCVLELPPEETPIRASCLVFHGAWAAKEGKLGVYSTLAAQGIVVVIPDAPLHGERQAETPVGLNAREYVWESVRRSVAEMPAVLETLDDLFGVLPVWVTGSSMGGYVTLSLLQTLPRVQKAAALITSGVWHEPEVGVPELRAFLEQYRPVANAVACAPAPLLLASGEVDPAFPLDLHHTPTAAALRQAYAGAGAPERFQEATFPGVGHYTSQRMRDLTVRFLLAE